MSTMISMHSSAPITAPMITPASTPDDSEDAIGALADAVLDESTLLRVTEAEVDAALEVGSDPVDVPVIVAA